MSEEIDLIRRIAIEHREIHVRWKLYYENNPEEEEIYGNYSGSCVHQQKYIDEYDQILAALNKLELAEVIDNEPTCMESIETKRAILQTQFTRIRTDGWVVCPCGRSLTWDHAYRCYGCGIFFCDKCGSRHFKIKRPLMAEPKALTESERR